MLNQTLSHKVHYTLRIAIAMCFIGHGAFGIVTKPIWCNYFAVVGINEHLSYQLMPFVGGFDILLGILILFYPMRVIPAWLVIWGAITASMRPLSGEPFAEFLERAGNYGVPFAFLILCGGIKNVSGWFTRIRPNEEVNEKILVNLTVCLQLMIFFLLAGHGLLNLVEKKSLLNQYTALGFADPRQVAYITGIAEIAFAFMVLIKPIKPLLLALFIWKMGSEMFYPNYGLFEWVERGGSFGAILVLWMITGQHSILKYSRTFLRTAGNRLNILKQ